MRQKIQSTENKKISIIIPAFNAGKYIKRCLSSILSQTFQNFEVIVIDDGSFDSTGIIVEEFLAKDNRIKKIYQSNQGPLCARILGLRFSEGEYFTFVDADDYYCSKQSLKIMYDVVFNNACDAVQFNSYIKYRFFRRKRSYYSDKIVTKDAFRNIEYPKILCSYWEKSKISVTVWDKIYAHRLINNIPENLYFEKTFMGDDLLLNLFLLENCNKFMFSSQCVYCYKTLTGSTNRWKEKDLYNLDVIKKYQAQVIKRCNVAEKDKIMRNYYAEIASWLFLHIEAGTQYLSQEQLIAYIDNVLKLDSFLNAKKYFQFSNSENWKAVNLLRYANPREYVLTVINEKKKESFISRCKSIIKKIV